MALPCFKNLERIVTYSRTRFNFTWTVKQKKSAEGCLRQPEAGRMYTIWAVSLIHAAIDTVRPALLLGERRGSAVDIAVVVPGTSTRISVERALGVWIVAMSSMTKVGGAVYSN